MSNLLLEPVGVPGSRRMIGKRKQQHDLFDVGYVWDISLDLKSFHGQLARAAPRLFRDEDFAVFYHDRLGRPSVPPSQLALLTILQHHAGVSDEEAIERTCWDARWAAVLGKQIGEPLCAKSTLQLFRSHLILHDEVLTIFRRSLQEAKEAGLLKGTPLRIALDTKPILGRGAVEDTYNLLATGIRQLCKALAKAQGPAGQKPEDWAAKHDLRRYFDGSLKGGVDLDWSDLAAKTQFLTEIVTDARRLLRLTSAWLPHLPQAAREPVREAAQLLEQLLLQDVVETRGPGGETTAAIKEGTAPGRRPSATDPEQRHGRKSKSKRFTGHKATVAVDEESQLIVGADVLAGDAPDATEVLEQVERVEANTGEAVAATVGDCAYGSGETRQEFAEAGRVLHAKVPQESCNGECFPKSRFVIDLEKKTVTCPNGVTSGKYTQDKEGGMLFHFGAACAACPLRAQCTRARDGRQVRVHPQEALLREARTFQGTVAGREQLRKRVVVEHGLARLGHLGIGQARYVGRQKTRFQLLLAATVANLRRTWNWAAAQALLPGPTPGEGSGRGAPEAARRCGWSGLRSWWNQAATWHCTRVAVGAM
jgi:hypothetical protein